MSEDKGETEAAIGVSLNANLSPTKQIVLQTHIPCDWSQDQINTLVDKLSGVIDRKEAFYQIEILENELEHNKTTLYSIRHNLDSVEANALLKHEASGKRTPFKWSPAELQQKKQAEDSVKRQTEIVAKCQARLDEARKKAGLTDGTASSANS